MKICFDQGYIDIRVVMAMKWRQYQLYLQLFFSAMGTVLPKSFTEAISSDNRHDCLEI